jgi:hypothetical protein
MMVATALFIVVALVITGALMMVLQSYRRVQSAKLAIDNLSFAMDNMILRLRDGTNYQPTNDGNYSSFIIFGDSEGTAIKYNYNTTDTTDKFLEKCDVATGICTRLTSPEVQITDLRFYIPDVDLDYKRPLVIVFVRGEVGNTRTGSITAFAFQTTISQRNARPAGGS